MKKTGFLFDRRYLLHETSAYHPEVPERLEAIHRGIEKAGLLPDLTLIAARVADRRWIEAVHDSAYIDRFGDACVAGKKTFDTADNQMCGDTFDTAMLAVGGILDTIDQVMSGQIDNAFCAVRPPGHHAERSQAMGFCYFNNVAIAAKYLQTRWQIRRVGIVDFDVHHGNGTQHIFESDPDVYYYSIHEHPSFAFPGTGRIFEKGAAQGTGFTQNNPILPGQGDAEYKKIFETDLIPEFEKFKPEFILVSTGFDAHVDDDMSGVSLTTDGYSWIMETVTALAERLAAGRIVLVLEGGYCLERLPELASNHVRILMNAHP